MYDIYMNGKYIGKGAFPNFVNFVATEKHNWNESDRGEELDVMFVGGPIAGKSMRLKTPLESIMEIPYPCKRGEEGGSFAFASMGEETIGYTLVPYKRVNCLRVGSVHYEWEHTVAMDKLPEKYQRLIVRR